MGAARCLYLLQGPHPSEERPLLYVGEADDVRGRLDQQAKSKDFWTLAVAFTSKDDTLNKAHVRYLESRLLTLATQVGRVVLDNGTAPTVPPLSEADVAEADGFLAELLVVAPLAGVTAFEALAAPSPSHPSLRCTGAGGASARGRETPEGFVVEEGSRVRLDTVASVAKLPVMALRQRLVASGVLLLDGGTYVFSRDHVFGSPSTAAAVVLGRTANGRVEWKTAEGRTLKELQEEALPSG